MKERGFRYGLHCFFQRKKQCRAGYQIIYTNDRDIEIKLADGTNITENELSETMMETITGLKRHFLQ